MCLDYISDHGSGLEEEFEDPHSSRNDYAGDGGAVSRPSTGASPDDVEEEFVGSTARPSSAGPRIVEILIRIQRKANRKTWDKKLVCLYCGVKQLKLARHFQRKHATESEVIEAFSYPSKSKTRRELLSKLSRKGNFNHNTKVLREGQGEIIPVRRPQRDSKAKKFSFESCDQCLGFFRKTTLLRHKIKVHGMSPSEQSLLCEDAASTQLQELLTSMEADDISTACKTDMLIMKFGSRMISRLSDQPGGQAELRQRMRELGKVLLEFRKIEEGASLQTCLDPTRFERLAEVVRQQAARDGGTGRRTRGFVRTVGKSLSTCARILKILATIAEDDCLKQKACGSLEAFKKEWLPPRSAGKSLRKSPSHSPNRSTEAGGEGWDARRFQTRVDGNSDCSDVLPETCARRSHEREDGSAERIAALSEHRPQSPEREEGNLEGMDLPMEQRHEGHDQPNGHPEGCDLPTEQRCQSHERTEGHPQRSDEATDTETQRKQRLKRNKSWRWNKKLLCLYCGAKQYKLARHLQTKHATESEVIEAFSYSSKSKRRRELLLKLAMKGNFNHNTKVLREGQGEIIPVRRPPRNSQAKKPGFQPCDQCLGFFRKTTLLRHKIKVHGMSPLEQSLLCEDAASTGLQEFLTSVEADDISAVCKSDMLIMNFGSRKISRLSDQPGGQTELRERMRELGQILLKFREIEEGASLQTCLDPTRFERLAEVVRQQAEIDDPGRVQTFVRTVGKSLCTCVRILKMFATIAGDDCLKQKACGFLEAYRKDWLTFRLSGRSPRESPSASPNRSTEASASERADRGARRCQQKAEGSPESNDAPPQTRSGSSHERGDGRAGHMAERCSESHERADRGLERSSVTTVQRARGHERTEGHSEGSDMPTEQRSESNERTVGHPKSSDAPTERRPLSHERTEVADRGSDVPPEERSRSSTVGAKSHPGDSADAPDDCAPQARNGGTIQGDRVKTGPEQRHQADRRGAQRKRPAGHRNYKRIRWTPEEKEAVERRLDWFVRNHVVPGIDYCQTALEREPALGGRTWRDIKYCVYNLIQRSRRNGGRPEDESE